MKVETTPREDHQATLTVEIEQDRMESAKHRAAHQIAKRGKIAGFRPGKAPYDVIRRQYGDEAILEGAIDILLEEVYPLALEEANIEPAAAGSLEKVEKLEPPVFIFTVPLKPEVDLGDYRKIRKAYKWKKPKKQEVDAKLEELQKMYATTVVVDRPVVAGDYLMTTVVGQKSDAADGEEPVWDRESHAVYIAPEERENELPFVGFGKQLIGMSPEERKVITHTFAADHKDEALQGATVNFDVLIKTVRGAEFPELDDEFAKTVGGGDTLEELRTLIEQNLEAESRVEYDDEYFSELIEKIKEKATIKYPPQVLDHKTEYVIEDITQRLARQGIEFETYLKIQDTDLEKFTEEEARPVARKSLERSLIFDEIARLEEIELTENDLEAEFNRALTDLERQGYDLKKVKGGERVQRKIVNNIAMQSATQIITRRTLERLKEIATGELAKAEKEAANEEAAPTEGEEKPKKKAPAKKKAAKTEAPKQDAEALEESKE